MIKNQIRLLTVLAFISFNVFAMDEMNCNVNINESGKKFPQMMPMSSMKTKYDQLRTKLPTLSRLSNEQINNMMKMMGPNYYWPIKNNPETKDGLLILAHGFGKQGDDEFYESMKELGDSYITSLSLGMSMMASNHISCSLIEIKKNKIENVYVIPVTSTPYNTLFRQWKYIFQLEEDFTYADVNQVKTQGIVFLEPISDSIFAKKIILEYAEEISINQKNEVVIIIAHGPVDSDDNAKELLIMDNIAEFITDNSEFHSVRSFTLQDDASKEVRENNVQRIKEFINNSNEKGMRVLMVSNLMSGKGIQKNIKKDFNNLDYTFNSKGLSTHPYFKEWILDSIESR